jgi:hypothetical protein
MFKNTIYALIILCLKVAEIIQATAEMHIDNESAVKGDVEPAVIKNKGKGAVNCGRGKISQELYETPRSALQPLYDGYLKDNVPTSSICFDPCCGHDAITDFLREMGYPNVIGYDRITKLGQQFNIMWDKFPKCDVVIINPIYSLIHDILELLIELGVFFVFGCPYESCQLASLDLQLNATSSS